MWSPKYIEIKQKALEIGDKYKKEALGKGRNSLLVVEELSSEYNVSIKSVYRYLKYAKIELPGRKRDEFGRFVRRVDNSCEMA